MLTDLASLAASLLMLAAVTLPNIPDVKELAEQGQDYGGAGRVNFIMDTLKSQLALAAQHQYGSFRQETAAAGPV